MRRTKEDADITRLTLLKAALVVFSKHGYAATRLEDIAQEANVTRGAIYHHFGGKAELYNALASEFASGVNRVIMQAIEQGGGTIEILRRVLIGTWEYLESNDDFRAVMELTMFKTGIDPELEEGMKMKRQGTRIMVEKLAEMLHEGIVKHELRADLDPMEIARSFLALHNGLALLWLLDPEAFSLRHSAYSAAEIFMRGIQA